MHTNQIHTKHFLSGKRPLAGKERENSGELKSGSADMTGKKNFEPLTYNMKKFKAITVTGIEFLFAPCLEQAEKMFYQLYPCGILQELTEVQINY